MVGVEGDGMGGIKGRKYAKNKIWSNPVYP